MRLVRTMPSVPSSASWPIPVGISSSRACGPAGGPLFNCAATLFGGRVLAAAPKVLRAPLVPAGGACRRARGRAARAVGAIRQRRADRTPAGEILAETARFVLTGSYAIADVDLGALLIDRMRMSSFGQNAERHRQSYRSVVAEPPVEERPAATFHRLLRNVAAQPFVPSDSTARDARCRNIFDMLCTSLARRLRALPAGRRVVLGVSGGQDSTLALLPRTHRERRREGRPPRVDSRADSPHQRSGSQKRACTSRSIVLSAPVQIAATSHAARLLAARS